MFDCFPASQGSLSFPSTRWMADIPPKSCSPGAVSTLWPWGLGRLFAFPISSSGHQEAGGTFGERQRWSLQITKGGWFLPTENGNKKLGLKHPCGKKGGRGPGPGQPHLGANRWNKSQPNPGALAPGPPRNRKGTISLLRWPLATLGLPALPCPALPGSLRPQNRNCLPTQ